MPTWDERYAKREHINDEPHPLVTKFVSNLPSGSALDVACGLGRHALWLAERGWQVTAVDSSPVAMQILEEQSRDKGLSMNLVAADLERREFPIKSQTYDLIVVCNYLQRDLFSSIREGTRIGGIVIASIPMVDDDASVKPMNPSFLLNPGELRAEFAGWELIHSFEGKLLGRGHRATADIVARRLDSSHP
jgi:SAM-dependent methyltransferase